MAKRCTGREALALGSTLALALVSCSEEYIELRPISGDADVIPASPGAGPEDADPTPNDDGAGGYTTGATPAGSDNVLLPSGEFPGLLMPEAPRGGCSKIDFLFVIDNSDSMDDEQANLAKSFPEFVTVMNQELAAKDFHIMVVGTDGDDEEEEDGEGTLDLEDCEDLRGAGKRRNEEGSDCGIQDGLAFMTAQQPELAATFSCVADVGTDGSAFEKPIESMLQAAGASLNAPGHCNEGFLREDAMLVVTLITDEEDTRSEGDPEDWRRLLLEAKLGKEDAFVVLGLVGDNNVEGGLPNGPCGVFDADGSPRLQTFVNSFEQRGVLGSVCAADYAPFFGLTLESIDTACQEFVPPVIF
jgi:hypothetical protein